MATATPSHHPSNQIRRSELQLVKERGEGGFSTVYQMTWMHPSLGPIEIAAKKLIKRDVKELEIMSGLEHPNIVRLLGVVDEEMEFMLILELCERGSLRSYLQDRQGEKLPGHQFYDWAEQAARPLEYLRQKHIVHKDVKSPNYMVTADDTLKSGDFGIAKNIEQTINNATETASWRWMAPELLTQSILSPKYDIFAYAVVLWELRTGRYPFEGLEPQVIAWKVCQKKERLPIPEDLPKPIKDLMKRCWKADWKKRPSIEVIAVITKTAVASKEARQQQIIRGPWRLVREFVHQGPGKLEGAKGIVVNPSNKDVAVTSLMPPQVKVFTSNGRFKFSMDASQGLRSKEISSPHQVTVNSQCTTYFVTDLCKHVKSFDSDAQFKHQWVSLSPEASPDSIRLAGLDMDNDGHVLAGDISNKCINHHTQEGTHLGSVKVGIEPWFIAVTSENTIVVVGESHEPPQIVNYTGQVMCALKHPVHETMWMPYGVYIHEGIILVVNIPEKGTGNILCFSSSGEDPATLPISGIHPRNIAMTPDGRKLLVLSSNTVIKEYSL